MEFDFIPFDFQRMFLGEASLLYLLEIVIRTVLIFCYGVLLMRLLGKEAMNKMTFVDYFIVIALGSATGDSMFYPSVPLLYAAVVITVIVLLKELLTRLMLHFDFIRQGLEAGKPDVVIKEGRIDHKQLRANKIHIEEFLWMLRVQGIENTGQVKISFLESSWKVSIFRYDKGQEMQGESTLPDQYGKASNKTMSTS